MELRDKVIIVTGASGGIGEATARLLAERGAKVVLAARSKDKLEAMAAELPGAMAVPTDMRDPKAIKDLVAKTVEAHGRVDVLINNAGQGMFGTVETIDLEQYQEMIELNVYGPLRAMQAVIPVMRAQGGGAIVNISSQVTQAYYTDLGGYASTKYALNGLSLTIQQEVANDKIAVSTVYPGLTETNFGDNVLTMTEIPGWMKSDQMKGDKPEKVAEVIAKAIESGKAELDV